MRIATLALAALLGLPGVADASPARELLVPMPPRVNFAVADPASPAASFSTAWTDVETATIYYLPPLERFARAHEIGHLLDAEVLTDGDRRFFGRLMQVPGPGPWNRGTGTAGLASPNEWFADYYAAAALRLTWHGEIFSAYAQIGPRRLGRFKRALARFGRRYSLQPYT